MIGDGKTYITGALVGDVHSQSESENGAQVGEDLHAGVDPDQAAERCKADQEGTEGVAADEGGAHDESMDRYGGAIVTSARPTVNSLDVGKVQEWIGRVACFDGVEIDTEACERAVVVLLEVGVLRVRFDRLAGPGRPYPTLSFSRKVHRSSLPAVAILAEDVGCHLPVLDAGSCEQRGAGFALLLWFLVAMS